MTISTHLFAYGLRQVCNLSDDAAGLIGEAGGPAARVVNLIRKRFTDHSLTLPRALEKAHELSWQALEKCLAGKGMRDRIAAFFSTPTPQALQQQVQAFLERNARRFDSTPEQVRQACLAELREARKQGVLTRPTTPEEVANRAAAYRGLANPTDQLADAQQAAASVADALAAGYPNLTNLLRQENAEREPALLVVAFSYFFRREVETNAELARGLTLDSLQQLFAGQGTIQAGVADLQAGLQDHAGEMRYLLQQVLAKIDQSANAPPTVSKASGYQAEISRRNPACLILLVDQSGSMAEPFGLQPGVRKADGVVESINSFLENLVIKCARADGVRDYFRIGVFGYADGVSSAFGGTLAGKELVSIQELADNPRVEKYQAPEPDGRGGQILRKKVRRLWVEPKAGGKTNMGRALARARELATAFLKDYPTCFPPIVLNFTDGQPTDDPTSEADALRRLESSDGQVLLFNAHLSKQPLPPQLFPADEVSLPDDRFARAMLRISSTIPETLAELALVEGIQVPADGRGFVFNADLNAVVKFFIIGTTVTRNALRRP